jgi:predicted DsbA family dithiol-disulfide isomerase
MGEIFDADTAISTWTPDALVGRVYDSRMVLHWYDFLCPFCYIGQHLTDILVRRGLKVIALPSQAHPDIPSVGLFVGPRTGPMYQTLERKAEDAGLALNWPPRLPDSRQALAAAEWTRRHQPATFSAFSKALFEAHFVLGEDISDPAVIDRHASALGINLEGLHAALADGSAVAAVAEAEALGRRFGVQGTPAWLLAGRMIAGLRPAEEFEQLADCAAQSAWALPQSFKRL